MSRLFDGSGDEINWSNGSIVGTGAWTFAMVVKFDAGVSWQGMLNLENSGSHRVGTERIGTSGNFGADSGNGANTRDSGISVSSSDGWVLLAASRPSGLNQTVRFTKYPIGGSPTHADSSAPGIDNQAAPDTIMFGNTQGADDFKGRLAVVGYWDTNLNDASMESLVTSFTRENWLSLSPKFVADELDAFVTDYAGTSTRTSITGTADDADDPAGWSGWAAGTPQKLRPDADIATTGWATAPLFSKVNEESADGTVITATAS